MEGLAVTVRAGLSTIYAINDNNGSDYAFVAAPDGQGYIVPEAYKQPPQGIAGAVAVMRALASITTTDVLLIGLDESRLPVGLSVRPTEVDGRAAWYSFGFLLRLAAAKLLDVDPTELNVGLRIHRVAEGPRAEVFLADRLENGAGYSTYLANDQTLKELFRLIGTEAELGTIAHGFATHEQAGKSCDSSCYDCLRDYGNMAYHGLLDWRLALDLADLAAGRPLPEARWLARAAKIRERLCAGFNWAPVDYGPLSGIERPAPDGPILLTHPLWSPPPRFLGPTLAEAYTAAQAAAPDRSIACVSLFDAVRRPGQLAWLR